MAIVRHSIWIRCYYSNGIFVFLHHWWVAWLAEGAHNRDAWTLIGPPQFVVRQLFLVIPLAIACSPFANVNDCFGTRYAFALANCWPDWLGYIGEYALSISCVGTRYLDVDFCDQFQITVYSADCCATSFSFQGCAAGYHQPVACESTIHSAFDVNADKKIMMQVSVPTHIWFPRLFGFTWISSSFYQSGSIFARFKATIVVFR